MTYIGLVFGGILGGFLAVRRKGKMLDILQYVAVCAIIGALIALILNVIILRFG